MSQRSHYNLLLHFTAARGAETAQEATDALQTHAAFTH